jgi:Ca2+/Na+ antiporter
MDLEPSSLNQAILFVAAGLVVLAGGGEVLVRGAINASRLLKITPVVIGLTVVALATSLPELAVSLLAAMRGSPDVAVGNVVGSNMFNIAVIIGLSAILFPPLKFRSAKLRFDVTVMIVAAAALIALGWNGFVGRLEGVVLMAGLAVFLWIRVRSERTGDGDEGELEAEAQRAILRHGSKSRGVMLSTLLIFVGAGLLTAGAEALVRVGGDGSARAGNGHRRRNPPPDLGGDRQRDRLQHFQRVRHPGHGGAGSPDSGVDPDHPPGRFLDAGAVAALAAARAQAEPARDEAGGRLVAGDIRGLRLLALPVLMAGLGSRVAGWAGKF